MDICTVVLDLRLKWPWTRHC